MSNKQSDTLKTMSISYYYNDFSTNRYEFIPTKICLKGFIKIINKSCKNCFYFLKHLFLIYIKIYFFVFLKLYMFRHVSTLTLKKMLNTIILIQLSALYTYPGYCINTQTGNFATQVSKINYTDLRQSSRDNQSSFIEGFSLALGINISTTVSDIQAIEINTQESRNDDYDILSNLHMKDDDFSISNNSSTLLMPNADTFVIGEHNIYKFVSRENILKQHQFQNFNLSATDKSQEINSKLPISKISTCPSCSSLEKAKIDNLESIKMHILRRLHLTSVPHITTPLHVPESILENFYNNYNRHSRRENQTRNKTNLMKRKDFDLEDYKLDKPKNSKSTSDSIFDENMQKDDYQAYNHDILSQTIVYDEDINSSNKKDEDTFDHFTKHIFEDDTTNYVSHIHSIFIFPTVPKYRHNRKQEILLFKFENSFLTVSKTILHIYVRGREYFRKTNAMQLMEENQKRNDIILVINRAVRRTNTMNYTHLMKLMEYHQQIPSGLGKWIQIEIEQLSQFWKENPGATQGILIKGAEPWMRNFIVTNDKNFILHVEVQTREHRRHKRSTSLDCQESDNEVRCCRYPLKVNFTNFGWHFVVAPTSFDAYFCNGECKVGYLEHYTHTHLASLTTSATPCCSPTKMSSLNLLYFNLDQNLVMSTIPNMSVEKCSCS